MFEDVLNVGKFLSGFFVFRVDFECALETASRLGKSPECAENQAKIEKCFVTTAMFALGSMAVDSLSLGETSGGGEQRTKKNVVGGIGRPKRSGSTEPTLG